MVITTHAVISELKQTIRSNIIVNQHHVIWCDLKSRNQNRCRLWSKSKTEEMSTKSITCEAMHCQRYMCASFCASRWRMISLQQPMSCHNVIVHSLALFAWKKWNLNRTVYTNTTLSWIQQRCQLIDVSKHWAATWRHSVERDDNGTSTMQRLIAETESKHNATWVAIWELTDSTALLLPRALQPSPTAPPLPFPPHIIRLPSSPPSCWKILVEYSSSSSSTTMRKTAVATALGARCRLAGCRCSAYGRWRQCCDELTLSTSLPAAVARHQT